MSTHRGQRRPAPQSMEDVRPRDHRPPVYRCVYCSRIFDDRDELPSHEAQCDARFIVERQWANQRAKFAARENDIRRTSVWKPVRRKKK